jgi:hypothetical protein
MIQEIHDKLYGYKSHATNLYAVINNGETDSICRSLV